MNDDKDTWLRKIWVYRFKRNYFENILVHQVFTLQV